MLIDSEETYKILCEEYPLLQKEYLRRVIDEVPSAEPNILDDGTLTITVPHGMLGKVNRVIVDEVGTKFCKMMYQDAVPSAERVGKWIIKGVSTFDMAYGSTGYEPVYECSNCGGIEESYLRLDEPIMPEDADFPRYCPNCGARMEGEEE